MPWLMHQGISYLVPMHSVSSSTDGGCFCFCLVFRLTEKSNRPVFTLRQRTKQSPLNKIRAPKTLFIYEPESKIFFAIAAEISKLGSFVTFMYC